MLCHGYLCFCNYLGLTAIYLFCCGLLLLLCRRSRGLENAWILPAVERVYGSCCRCCWSFARRVGCRRAGATGLPLSSDESLFGFIFDHLGLWLGFDDRKSAWLLGGHRRQRFLSCYWCCFGGCLSNESSLAASGISLS